MYCQAVQYALLNSTLFVHFANCNVLLNSVLYIQSDKPRRAQEVRKGSGRPDDVLSASAREP
nr:MAG TPA: hypothetical protein [Caudoviricetes sp.]